MFERKRVGVILFAVLALVVAYCVAGIVNETRSRAKVLQNSDVIFFAADKEMVLDETLSARDNEKCEAVAKKVIGKFDAFLEGLDTITIHHRLDLRRGLASSDKIWMRCLTDLVEFEKVLIHELAHTIAANHMKDEVAVFYSYGGDSVSGYGSEKVEEDFAESFLMYIKYGPEFRQVSLDNNELNRKYRFLMEKVFDGHEFEAERAPKDEVLKKFESKDLWPYDVTVLHKR
jgi:hypothetical protein